MDKVAFFSVCPVCTSPDRREVIEFAELTFVKCDHCSLIYKAHSVPMLGIGYEEEYFRFNRAKYLTRWNHRVRKCRRQIIDCLQFVPTARVLCDVGCSAGYVLEAGKRLGLEPIGVDSSRFAVELCRERGFRGEMGSHEALPLAESSVDVLTSKHTLEHVREPLKALQEVARVLKPGGVALIVVPDAAYWKLTYMPRKGRSFRPDRRGWQHHVYFYEHNLVDACRRAGLNVIHRGKAVPRAGAQGLTRLWEQARFGWLSLYSAVGRATTLRREMQVFAQKPHF